MIQFKYNIKVALRKLSMVCTKQFENTLTIRTTVTGMKRRLAFRNVANKVNWTVVNLVRTEMFIIIRNETIIFF